MLAFKLTAFQQPAGFIVMTIPFAALKAQTGDESEVPERKFCICGKLCWREQAYYRARGGEWAQLVG